uniref:heme transporter FLVCR2-like isoform X2 n=1 Tax=Myxine glutinosa TaxID=7769 RepID=UPI0035900140
MNTNTKLCIGAVCRYKNKTVQFVSPHGTPHGMDEPEVRENRTTDLTPDLENAACKTRVYRRRWGILALFCLHSMSSSFQWIEFSILNDVFTRFYHVQTSDIDWLSMTYMFTYLLLILPVTWILSHRGLRFMALVANILNCLGAWVKALGVRPDLFWVAVFGQTLCGVAQVFILSMPPLIAAVWFGPTEVSTACAIGVFGNQIGTAFGFLVPPLIVPNESNDGHLAWDIRLLLYGIAAFNTVNLILIILLYQDKPPHPPSIAQATAMDNSARESYKDCISGLIHNKDFLLLTFCYGLSAGAYYSLATLLNQTVLYYYPRAQQERHHKVSREYSKQRLTHLASTSHIEQGKEVETGWIGLTIVVTGVVSALLAGFWLDQTHTYKMTILVVNILTFIAMVVYTFTMDLGHIWVIFITAGLLGSTSAANNKLPFRCTAKRGPCISILSASWPQKMKIHNIFEQPLHGECGSSRFFMTSCLPIGFEFAAELTYPHSEGISSGFMNASSQVFGIILILSQGRLMTMFGPLAGNLLLGAVLLLSTIATDPRDARRGHKEDRRQPVFLNPQGEDRSFVV